VDQQVVGRAGLVAQLDRFVRGLAVGSGSLVIEGEAGIGKTTLWQAGVTVAEEGGYRVLVSRPAESETSLAYSGLADLLAHVDESSFEGLPVPQRRALEVALHLSEPTGRSPEPRAIFAAFGGVLRRLALDAPVLVAVDDQQWLDASSLSALEFVSRRLADTRIGILTTARRVVDVDVMHHPGLPGAVALRLEALSPAVLYELIKARIGVSLPRSTVLRVHRTTSGNPFFALELARVLVAAGLPGPSDAWPVPEDLREMVAVRVGQLPVSARSALLAVAAGARPMISTFIPSDLEAAELAGIIAIARYGRVRFAHPLFASAIYEGATADERQRVHAELAGEDSDPEEQARHRALACRAADEEVAGVLDLAAAKARARGAPDVAAELAELARALTPLDRPEQAWRRQVTVAEHHVHAGDLERARALLVELVERSDPVGSRSNELRLLGEVCYSLRYREDAVRYLREAVDAAEGDLAASARAELDLAFVLFYSFDSFAGARDAAHRALAMACRVGDPVVLASALAGCAVADLLFGFGLDEDKLEQALSLEDPDQPSPVETRPSLLVGLALLQTDQFDRARAVLELLSVRLVERGEEGDLPHVLALRARLECLNGNVAEAAQLADQGYELARQAESDSMAAHVRAVRALVDAHAGRIDETRAAAADAVGLAGRSGWHLAPSGRLRHLDCSRSHSGMTMPSWPRSRTRSASSRSTVSPSLLVALSCRTRSRRSLASASSTAPTV
jgi:tetratricopeptide (TPR) repeat protein